MKDKPSETAQLRDGVLKLLRESPLTLQEMRPKVRQILPHLCDDSEISRWGEPKWHHKLRAVVEQLKKDGIIIQEGSRGSPYRLAGRTPLPPEPPRRPQPRSTPPSHNEIRDMVREIGELLYQVSRVRVKFSETEYPLDGRRLDVVWKTSREGKPRYAFEVQLGGNIDEATTKIKEALEKWNSKPCLVGDDQGIQRVRERVEGTFPEIEDVSFIHWRQVVDLRICLIEVERILREANLIRSR